METRQGIAFVIPVRTSQLFCSTASSTMSTLGIDREILQWTGPSGDTADFMLRYDLRSGSWQDGKPRGPNSIGDRAMYPTEVPVFQEIPR